MDMKECPGLSNIVQENTGGARNMGAQKQYKREQRLIVIWTDGGKLHQRKQGKSLSVVELTEEHSLILSFI